MTRSGGSASAAGPWKRRRRGLVSFLLLCFFVLVVDGSSDVYRYNICNGLSNQLLYHSASIAIAVEQGKEVEIPNHFIVNGVQQSDDSVLPSQTNSVPFSTVFDSAFFLQTVQGLGIKARLVEFDFHKRPIPCAGLQSLHQADPQIVLKVLKAFRPSSTIQKLIRPVTEELTKRGLENGICVHHRDGQDWYDHCARWSSINDGIYRGNCLGVPGRSFVESLEDRGLKLTRPVEPSRSWLAPAPQSRWIYYCGDHDIPRELKSAKLPYQIFSRHDFLTETDRAALSAVLGDASQSARDLWALVDFCVCSSLEHFIGNSVSTFSAVQIALRNNENAFWYNSQSIPLGDIWHAYSVPIVYTYTELSKASGKHLLQASIASVRKHMPDSRIHMLYHGKDDKAFQLWLTKHGVELHQHDPTWRGQIEAMRKNGDPATSHLFLHPGNYFGTWQRIDIPLFLNSEYCLQLDADTIVLRPFTLADFGLDMTYGIAMSAELKPDDRPANAGVTLMNIPRMRQTYHDFLEFILQHVHSAKFDHPSPSDQGAYLDFYKPEVRFLAREFNFKPYWKLSDIGNKEPFILHFHGAKPHDYLKHIMGDRCDEALRSLCEAGMRLPYLCKSLKIFAEFSKSVDQVAYCNNSFKDAREALFCNEILDEMTRKPDVCYDFPTVMEGVLNRMPDELDLPKELIRKNIRKGRLTLRDRLLFPPVFVFYMLTAAFGMRWIFRRPTTKKGRHDF